VALADFEGITANTTYVLESKDPEILLPELLPFLMQAETFHEHSKRESKGSVNPYVNFSDLAWYEFALPPLEEQRRIAEVLQATQANSEAIRHTVASSKDVLDSFLETQLDPKRQKWTEASIQDLFLVQSGGTPSRRKREYWGGSVPWVKTGEVRYQVINETEEKITEIGLKNSSAKLVPAGTVLVALFGQGPTLGRVGMLGIEAATNQACACIIPNNDQSIRFLYFFLQRQYERMRALARGANQPNLNLTIIKNLKVPLLPIEQQLEWVSRIEEISSAVTKAKARLDLHREFSKQLLASLLGREQ